jgi:hypothetical protein
MFSTGNNLYIGNATFDKEIIIFNGGLNAQDNARMWIHNQGTVVIGGTGSYNGGNPPALQINPLPGTTTYNIVEAQGDIDEYCQIGVINLNTGSSASTDIVAYNSSAGEAQVTGFIDMGINSPNYTDINFPGWTGSDSYVYSDSPRMLVGTTNTGSSYINFFVGGLNVNTNSKLKLYSSSFHQLTGSLNATNGFTGSLFGTASFAVSASWAPGGTSITVKDDGSTLTTALTSLDFAGAGVTATNTGGAVTVTIPGGGGSPFPYVGDAVITGSLAISQSLLQYSATTAITAGAPVNIASFPTSSYRAGFFDYVAFSSTNARAGTVMTVWNGANVEFNETSTNDIGTTSALTLSASLSGANIRLQGVSTSGTWTVETLARLI